MSDNMIRCIPDEKVESVLAYCHYLPCGGHAVSSKTAAKVLECDFFWPSLCSDTWASWNQITVVLTRLGQVGTVFKDTIPQ